MLRGYPHTGQLSTEHYFCERLHRDTDVPVPWPYLLERDPTLFGWEYAIMPRLPGVMCGVPEIWNGLSHEDHLGIAAAMGSALARLQAPRWPVWGHLDETVGGVVGHSMPYRRHIVDGIEDQLRESREASDATSEEDVTWLLNEVEKRSQALDVPFEPSFVHHDYKRGNSLVQCNGASGWRVSGVFDLQEAHAGDGEADLSRTAWELARLNPELMRTFVRAYCELRPPRAHFLERFAIYSLRDRVVIWLYGQRNQMWFPEGLTLRQWLEPLLESQLSHASRS